MGGTHFWTRDHFPVVYEQGEPKAVLVDITSFAQFELVMDNLLNREEEPEDAILAASDALKRLVAQVQQESASADWERELDEL